MFRCLKCVSRLVNSNLTICLNLYLHLISLLLINVPRVNFNKAIQLVMRVLMNILYLTKMELLKISTLQWNLVIALCINFIAYPELMQWKSSTLNARSFSSTCLHYVSGWTHLCVYLCLCVYLHVHVCCCLWINDHLPGCDFSDSGGFTCKSVALSLVLSPMKRVQSSPNLGTGTNTHKHIIY